MAFHLFKFALVEQFMNRGQDAQYKSVGIF